METLAIQILLNKYSVIEIEMDLTTQKIPNGPTVVQK